MRDRVGGIVGPTRFSTTTAASGMWTMRDHFAARSAGTWPPFEPPRSISGLFLWYDFADLSTLRQTGTSSVPTATGQNVLPTDKSGNSRDLQQYSTSPVITYPDRNGLPALSTLGWSYRNDTSFLSFVHNSASTIAFAFQPGTVANPNATYFLFGTNSTTVQDSSGNGFQVFWADSQGQGRNDCVGFIAGRNDTNAPTAINYSSNGAVVANTWNYVIHTGDMTNATAAERSKFYINGGFAQANNAFANTPAAGSQSQQFWLGNNSFAGRFGEVMIFNRVLSAAEIATLNSYFASKWGI